MGSNFAHEVQPRPRVPTHPAPGAKVSPMNIHAPFAGIVRFLVADGTIVTTGQELAIVEAVKLEAPVLAPGPGRVVRSIHDDFVDVAGGDILMQLEPEHCRESESARNPSPAATPAPQTPTPEEDQS